MFMVIVDLLLELSNTIIWWDGNQNGVEGTVIFDITAKCKIWLFR